MRVMGEEVVPYNNLGEVMMWGGVANLLKGINISGLMKESIQKKLERPKSLFPN